MTSYPTAPISIDSIDGLTWIRGDWIEDTGDRRCEEVWSGPSADTLMGMFRWISRDEVSFFEFMAIRLSDGAVELHAKHFHPTLVAWEDRHRYQGFVLSELTDDRAVFAATSTEEGEGDEGGWLVYERTENDNLIVRLIQATGEEKLTFHFARVT